MDKKNYLSIAILAICFMIFGCPANKIPIIQAKKIILFLDKSSSVSYSKGDSNINKILNECIDFADREGDSFSMLYIHSNTLGSNPEIDYKIESLKAKGEKETTLDFNHRKQRWGYQIKAEKEAILGKLKQKVFFKNVSQTNKATDLWAVFEKISTICDSTSDNRVVIFSDMIESMNGEGRRSALNPSSKEQAEDWARRDKTIIDSKF